MAIHVLQIPAGAWLLQTAAGSALGRMVIRLGKQYGFRTINVVRRREQAEELLKEGADVSPEDLREHLSRGFAKWQVPERVEFIDEIPRTATGKFKKIALREQFVKTAV